VLSQISGGNIEEVKTVKEKKVSSFNTDSLTGSSMNLTGFIQHSYRYFTHGEQYNYQDPLTDSTFFYSNAYHQLGIPLKLRYTYGNKLQVFGFAGITPLNILRIQYKNSYRTAEGSEIEVPTKTIKNDFTAFNLMASAGVGITYYLKQFGFTLYPEYRRHLMNTYSEDTFKRKHFMYGFALNAGFSVRF
jgi:hypothetical protein